MAGLIKKFAIGASVAAGMTALTGVPALAQIENPTLQGGESIIYEAVDTDEDGTVDTTQANPDADIVEVLKKMDGTPGGNIELFSDSEQSKYASEAVESCRRGRCRTTGYNVDKFAEAKVSSISGMVGGKNLTLSSLTAYDWFGSDLNTSYGADTLATTWFDAFLDAAGQEDMGKTLRTKAFNSFLGLSGFQRTSDANISYIGVAGRDIKIDLAGHYDLKAFYEKELGSFASYLKDGFQASEVVKYEYDGIIDYAFGFTATKSGLVETDGFSHNGNYEVSIKGLVVSTPEPSSVLGLMAIGGVLLASKKKSEKNG